MFFDKDRMIFLLIIGLIFVIGGILEVNFLYSTPNLAGYVTLVTVGGGMIFFSSYFLVNKQKKDKKTMSEKIA